MTMKIGRVGSEQYGRHLKMLVAGPPGSGKTRFSTSFPNVLLADVEARLMSISDRQIPFVQIKESDDLFEVVTNLQLPEKQREQVFGFKVETIVIDTLDAFQKLMIEERKRSERKESFAQSDWGWLGDQMRTIVRNVRNLPLNVIFTVHVRDDKDEETGQTFVTPALQGAMGDEISVYTDVNGLLQSNPVVRVRDGKTVKGVERFIQVGPDARHDWLKDHSGKLGFEFPINLQDDGERVLKTVFNGLPPVSQGQGQKPPTSQGKKTEDKAEKVAQAEGQGPSAPTVQTRPSPEPPATSAVSSEPKLTRTEVKTIPVPETATEPAMETVPPEPAPVVANGEAPKLSEVSEPAAEDDKMACAECGNQIGDENQRDLALVRFRKPLCLNCFKLAKTKKD